MNQFLVEVSTQGKVLRDCLYTYFNGSNENMSKIINLWQEKKFKRIVFAGMGSSYYAPFSVANYLTANEIPSIVMNAYELYQYQMGLVTPDTLLVAVSQSGSSKETVELVRKAKEQNTVVVGIVNHQDSPLAKEADIPLFIYAGKEKHISNKSYLNTLAVLQIFSAALVDNLDDSLKNQMYEIADWAESYLVNMRKNTQPVIDFISGTKSYDFLGNGPAMSTAYQAGLIFREGPPVTASSISCADFPHGWDLSVTQGYTAVVFDPEGKQSSVEEEVCENIIKKGGKVILITSAQKEGNDSLLVIQHPNLPEHLAPMAQIIPCSVIMGWLMEQGPNKDY